MQRKRDDLRWLSYHYQSVDEFLSKPRKSGAHAILRGDQYLDILTRYRGSKTTAVVFHAAVSDKTKTYPVFSGESFTHDVNINLIAVSDPSLCMGDIDLAWFLGNRAQGPLRPVLSPLIHHALSSMGTKRTILFGASGGGYAAANFAWDFPNSIALLINPRLNMLREPLPKISNYLSVCHQARTVTPMKRIRKEFVIDKMSSLASQGLNHHVLVYQNIGDTRYYEHQTKPFLRALKDDPRLFVQTSDDGPGHRHIPAQTLRKIIKTLSMGSDVEKQIIDAGFTHSSKFLSDTNSA